MTPMRSIWFLTVSSALLQTPSYGQQLCLEPSSGFHVDGVVGPDNVMLSITGIAGFDDGNGPALFVSGTTLASAGAEPTIGLAKWDGQQWSDTGVPVRVDDIAVYDGGSGAQLYVATGSAPILSTWNGTSLSPLADQPNGLVHGFDVIDLGTGPQLYISGSFTQVGSTPAPGIARWNGSSWSAVTNGSSVRGPFEAFDDGSGIKLYGISYVGSVCNPALVRLDGGGWTSLGELDAPSACVGVIDLQVHDDGSGLALYVAGNFATAGGVSALNVARWNGASWSALSSTTTAILGVEQLASFDDGSGSALYAGGRVLVYAPFQTYGILRWDGTGWQAVGSGLGTAGVSPASAATGAQALGVFDDGSGAQLVAAGDFVTAGSASVWGVARWDGAVWSGFGTSGEGTGRMSCLKYLDDGTGPALYAGGAFTGAGAVAASHIARWNGSAWTALGAGVNGSVLDVDVFDDGGGLGLYIGGGFTTASGVPADGAARWDGVQWSAVGAGPNSVVLDLFSHGNLLYAALQSGPGLSAWNGSAWSTVAGGTNGAVRAIDFYDGYLYATGGFNMAGGVPASGIARYNELTGTWSAAGIGIPGGGSHLVVHDDGSGPALYVGTSDTVRRLQGSTWTTLPSPGFDVYELASVDFGLGRPSLVVCGILSPPGVPLKTWTGTSWVNTTSDLVDRPVRAIAVVPGSSSCAPEVFVGGDFVTWGGLLSHHVAKLTLCGEPGIAYCFGDGSLATPCPCTPPNTVPSPSGAPGHGCANSFNLDGAKMCAVGTTNPDTVTLRVSGLTPVGFTQFFKGSAQAVGGIAYADGVRCVDGTIIRFGGQNAVLGTAYYPNPSLGLNAPLSNAGTPVGSGMTGHYQAIYRNVAANFCTASLLNISSAVMITWN